MKVQFSLKPALIGMVCLGILAPQTVSAGLLPSPKTVKAKPASKIPDIALTKDAIFRGVIVDGKAGPVANEKVVIRQGRRVVAETKTDRLGEFRVPKFRGGTYEIKAGKVSQQVRVWTANSAPKTARKIALLVENPTVVRAQSAIPAATIVNAASLGGAALGIGFGISNMQEVDDLEDKVNRNTNGVESNANSISAL